MNEPCRHERVTGEALTLPPATRSEVMWRIGELRAERDAALATIERVRALLGDTAGPLWSVRGVRESDLCAALEATS